jgi:hypothetical protein
MAVQAVQQLAAEHPRTVNSAKVANDLRPTTLRAPPAVLRDPHRPAAEQPATRWQRATPKVSQSRKFDPSCSRSAASVPGPRRLTRRSSPKHAATHSTLSSPQLSSAFVNLLRPRLRPSSDSWRRFGRVSGRTSREARRNMRNAGSREEELEEAEAQTAWCARVARPGTS